MEKNGFRAWYHRGPVAALALPLAGPEGPTKPDGEAQQVKIADLVTPPRVSSQHMQTRAGQRYEIASSSLLEKMPVLFSEGGEIHGLSYEQAQGIFSMSIAPQPDGRVQLELVPEIQYGQNQQHFVGDQSIFRLETGRRKRAFENLKLTAVMGPGAMLLLGSQPNRPGSLGHYFFSESDGRDDRLRPEVDSYATGPNATRRSRYLRDPFVWVNNAAELSLTSNRKSFQLNRLSILRRFGVFFEVRLVTKGLGRGFSGGDRSPC